MKTAISQQNDTVDLVCQRHYGRTVNVTEQVLLTNPGLALHGLVLPAGLEISLPDNTVQQVLETINLWD